MRLAFGRVGGSGGGARRAAPTIPKVEKSLDDPNISSRSSSTKIALIRKSQVRHPRKLGLVALSS